ncbi:MAG: transcription elongation factor GreB [Bacteriovoracaceae bacterium]|nr:transcription elongation factor GreB [Bacteriovoracaceae bacterium]
MSGEKNYITPQGLARLQAEYHQLASVERPQTVNAVAAAAANGDRSENADYTYGKKRLREIDQRLRFLGQRLSNIEVVDPQKIEADKILFGATVAVEEEDGQTRTWQIVGIDESNTALGKISWKSPVGQALLGKEEGDEVAVHSPQGIRHYTVVGIKYI